MKKIKSKKGQISFLIYLLVGLIFAVALAVFAVPMTYVGDQIFDELSENEFINASNESVSSISQVKNFMTGAADQLIFFLLGATLLGFLAVALFSDFHPIFLVVFILFIVLMVILGGLMTNVFDEVKSTEILQNKSGEFTLTNKSLGEQFPLLIAVFGAVGVIILLAKKGRATTV